ncbi:MAG: hypothetical protein HC938_08255 [Nitrospira sp.]|nr:hypothetical protein [Nitrospira sp.]
MATQEYFIEQASKDPEGTDRAGRMRTLLQEILGYVSTSTCRQLAILEYFSDDAERALGPCGMCDRCVAPVRQANRTVSRDAAVSAREVLETVSWCMGRFGLNRVVDILRGSRSKALLACGSEDCPTYGICRTQTKPAVTARVKALVDAGYLQVEGLEYPTLDVTTKGRRGSARIQCGGVGPGRDPTARRIVAEAASLICRLIGYPRGHAAGSTAC